MKTTVEAAKTDIDDKTLHFPEAHCDNLRTRGETANPLPAPTESKKRGKPKRTPAAHLLDRLRMRKTEALAYLRGFAVASPLLLL
jgi:hypothetical protein